MRLKNGWLYSFLDAALLVIIHNIEFVGEIAHNPETIKKTKGKK